jgi:hypothetical protein
MRVTPQIAKHFREVYFGGNWTATNLRDVLKDITWQQAIKEIHSFNTIATLTYHMHYYVHEVLKVLKGGPLDASDELSFNHPPIHSQQDWDNFLKLVWTDVEDFAVMIEQLTDDRLWANLSEEKYGIYYRNLHGIIEHTHYHLGQIVILKKLV